MLQQRLKEKKMSVYRCSKISGVPYTTLSEMLRGKTKIGNCSDDNVFRLAKALDTTVEKLLSESEDRRPAFETFKSEICHAVKDHGDMDFIAEVLTSDEIRVFWDKQWYPEALYLLAMIDYLSRVNGIPLCTRYDDLRSYSLREPLYPRDIVLLSSVRKNSALKEICSAEAIPEFKRFNIVESEVRNVR